MTERKNAGYNICNDFVLTSYKTDNSLRTNGKTRFFFLFIFFFGGRAGGLSSLEWNKTNASRSSSRSSGVI